MRTLLTKKNVVVKQLRDQLRVSAPSLADCPPSTRPEPTPCLSLQANGIMPLDDIAADS